MPQESLIQAKYFMPHHVVLRPDRLSTKLRVVSDALCHTSNGFSLNAVLFVGPKLQPDLLETLIRFRWYRFFVTADISKMKLIVRGNAFYGVIAGQSQSGYFD